jgi:hypothetical protein
VSATDSLGATVFLVSAEDFLSIAPPLCQPIGLAGSITGETSVLSSKMVLVNNKSIAPSSEMDVVMVCSDGEYSNCGAASTFTVEETSFILS